jgi:hypothetical protein
VSGAPSPFGSVEFPPLSIHKDHRPHTRVRSLLLLPLRENSFSLVDSAPDRPAASNVRPREAVHEVDSTGPVEQAQHLLPPDAAGHVHPRTRAHILHSLRAPRYARRASAPA